MPTYSQVVAYIDDIRAATPANPVSHTDFADVLKSVLDYFSNTGAWDPVAAMNVANSKANVNGQTFTGTVTFSGPTNLSNLATFSNTVTFSGPTNFSNLATFSDLATFSNSINLPVAGASAAVAAKGITFKDSEYILGYAGDTAAANLIGAIFSHLDSASYAFRLGKHTGAALLANGSNYTPQFIIANSGVGHFASRLHINIGSDFTDQTVPLYVNGAGRVVGLLSPNRLAGASAAPTIAAGTGAGTTPTISIVGNDIAGRITITTGTTPVANATIATVTFAGGAFAAAPYIHLTPSNQLAAALSGANMVFPSSTTTTLVLTSGTTALTAATTYTFNYLIIQ